ncbi:MAG: nucleotidyltransferase family protein [Paraglaciecola sp.]|nr:nucleotidyltransferase family protein [Paraglaciecola sp.]NCT47530.1 nucleotidyltransferase family protein [Paraglaciecola sp.]
MREALLLAAGNSQRFAGIKQLAMWQGQSLINHSVSQFYEDGVILQGLNGLRVALGANAQQIKAQLASAVETIDMQNWSQGIGATIAEAVSRMPTTTKHLLIALADQIAIKHTDFLHLIALSEQYPNHIIAARYADVVGVPAIFPQRFFSHLQQLSGDKGARSLFALWQDAVISVDMPHASLDVDTQQDLVNALHNQQT